MSRTEIDTQSVVAAIRAETRARLAMIRLEREAYREAQREKWRTKGSPVPDAVQPSPEPAAEGPDETGLSGNLDAVEARPEATLEQSTVDAAEAHSVEEDFCEAPPNVATAQQEPSAPDAPDELPAPDRSSEVGRRSKEQPSTKLRIAAAVTAATSGVSVQPPPAPVSATPEDAPTVPLPSDPGNVIEAFDVEADVSPPEAPLLPETLTPLAALTWLGPGLLRRLSMAGIHHVEELAARDAESLAADLGSVGRLVNVATLISEAQAARAG